MSNTNQQGFIALLSIIIIAAATLIIGLSVNNLSISESQMGLAQKKGHEAFMHAESCMEEALIQLRDNVNYDPDGASVTLDTITCTSIDVTGSGSDRTIIVSVTLTDDFGSFTKSIQTDVKRIGNSITVNSWTEL
jgi:hypothetical protein